MATLNIDLDAMKSELHASCVQFREAVAQYRSSLETKGIGSRATKTRLVEEYKNSEAVEEALSKFTEFIVQIDQETPEILAALITRMNEPIKLAAELRDNFIQSLVANQATSNVDTSQTQEVLAKQAEYLREEFKKLRVLMPMAAMFAGQTEFTETPEAWAPVEVVTQKVKGTETLVLKVPRLPGDPTTDKRREARTPTTKAMTANSTGLVFTHYVEGVETVVGTAPLSVIRHFNWTSNLTQDEFYDKITGREFDTVSTARDWCRNRKIGLIGGYTFFGEHIKCYRISSDRKVKIGEAFTL